MEKVQFSVEDIRKLAELVEKHSLAELTVEENGLCVTIKGASAAHTLPSTAAIGAVPHSAPAVIAQATDEAQSVGVSSTPILMEETPETEKDENIIEITAPMVGVFYRAPSPEAPHYIEPGDVIEIGQTIGLIEAMKVFSEIPAEIAGEVVKIPAQNGKLVQQGDILVVVRISKE